jgi:hypothetical protein
MSLWFHEEIQELLHEERLLLMAADVITFFRE